MPTQPRGFGRHEPLQWLDLHFTPGQTSNDIDSTSEKGPKFGVIRITSTSFWAEKCIRHVKRVK